ncbi:MAG TPA: adenine deaminase [Phycisphaerales bacterium]|nr:adenine deaminase [Phycisphaerales bacterium]
MKHASKGDLGRTDPTLLEVARGERPADRILRNASVVDVFTRTVRNASIAVVGERIAGVGDYTEAVESIDLCGAYVAPGLIDAHMHVESTMMLPPAFVRATTAHGTTGVVLDPHEIANVLGKDGIRMLMQASEGLDMNCFFALSSCVPSSPLETSGAELSADDLEPMFDDPRVVALAEVMNFPGVVSADPSVMAKVRLGLAHGRVDGHCPGLTGKALQAYAAAGISSEHECTTAEQALERVRAGMRVFIREGSAAKNLHAILPAVTPDNAHRFCFCTDDRHPEDLVRIGHIDHCVRLAIEAGLDPIIAICMATLHPAEHYNLHDLGAIAPGRFADMLIFDDLTSPVFRDVYFHGRRTTSSDESLSDPSAHSYTVPQIAYNTVHIPDTLSADDLKIPASTFQRIRVIEMDPDQIVTGESRHTPKIENSTCVSDPDRDILKICVIERHHGTGNIGLGFVHGFGIRRGAIASTVGHDAHNLIAVGTNDQDIIAAAQALAAVGGGQCAVCNGQTLAVLRLPIAGLMSELSSEPLIQEQQHLLHAVKELGCPIHDPFMPMSFLVLPVIPKLKLTDLGLVDVEQFKVVPIGTDDG